MVKHRNQTLVAVLTKHSDDVHVGATPEETRSTTNAMEKVFGTLANSVKEFTSVGVTHRSRTTDRWNYTKTRIWRSYSRLLDQR